MNSWMREDEAAVQQILRESTTIAVVGLADDPLRPSFGVASYMRDAGHRIVPVNPLIRAALGEPSYPSLAAAPGPIDLALIFRRPDAAGVHVDEAIALGIPAVWMQPGARNDAAAARARDAGLLVVVDRCIRTEHRRMRR